MLYRENFFFNTYKTYKYSVGRMKDFLTLKLMVHTLTARL
jgi:hypothetical protein